MIGYPNSPGVFWVLVFSCCLVFINLTSLNMGNKTSGSGDEEKYIDDMISNHAIVMFAKTTCGFCSRAHGVLEPVARKASADYVKVDLDTMKNGQAIQDALKEKTGQRTVPNVFIAGAHKGGCDDIMRLSTTGELQELIGDHATAPAGGAELATFGGGCFWGLELMYQRVPGVISTAVGYTQGGKEDPTYKEVCTGKTGHVEVVHLSFDPTVVSYEELCKMFWARINPYTLNRMWGDRGTQYRSGIYFHTDSQKEVAVATKAQVDSGEIPSGKKGDADEADSVVTEVLPAVKFWPAEDYHQHYLEKGGQSVAKGSTETIRCYG